MLDKVNFCGLHNIRPQDRDNLKKIVINPFIDSAAAHAFSQIDRLAGQKDVFVRTSLQELEYLPNLTEQYCNVEIVDKKGRSIASEYFLAPQEKNYFETASVVEGFQRLSDSFEKRDIGAIA